MPASTGGRYGSGYGGNQSNPIYGGYSGGGGYNYGSPQQAQGWRERVVSASAKSKAPHQWPPRAQQHNKNDSFAPRGRNERRRDARAAKPNTPKGPAGGATKPATPKGGGNKPSPQGQSKGANRGPQKKQQQPKNQQKTPAGISPIKKPAVDQKNETAVKAEATVAV